MFGTKAERCHGRLHSAVSWLITITLASLLFAGVAATQTQTKSETKPASASNHLRGGWYPWDPYQYRDYKRGVPVLTGFDVKSSGRWRASWVSKLTFRNSPGRTTWRRSSRGRPISPPARPRARHAVSMRISRNPIEPRRIS